jgi:hypothetical protein
MRRIDKQIKGFINFSEFANEFLPLEEKLSSQLL